MLRRGNDENSCPFGILSLGTAGRDKDFLRTKKSS